MIRVVSEEGGDHQPWSREGRPEPGVLYLPTSRYAHNGTSREEGAPFLQEAKEKRSTARLPGDTAVAERLRRVPLNGDEPELPAPPRRSEGPEPHHP